MILISLLVDVLWLSSITGATGSLEFPGLPYGPPLPAPAYMQDNVGNTHGAAPDKGTRNGPVLPANGVHVQLARNLTATTSDYWLSGITHGVSPYAPAGYAFYRDVTAYGAKVIDSWFLNIPQLSLCDVLTLV